MNIDLKNPAENYKAYIVNQLEKMLLAAEKIEPFKKIDFDVLHTDKVDVEVLKLKNVIYLINIADFGKNLNQHSFCDRIKSIKETQKKIKLPKPA